jgi:AcrR family transcriptional regulator
VSTIGRMHSSAAGPGHDEITDKRLRRGARTRRTVVDAAVDMASLDGLDSISFNRVAADAGLSKAGVQTLFGTKEALQLATVARARELFRGAVVEPTVGTPAGVRRLRALIDQWIVYAEGPAFAGGCFFVANLAEFDSRPGPVRDALGRARQDWIELIADELRHAVADDDLDLDPDLTAFEIDAVLSAANIALRLGDAGAMDKVRRIADRLLAQVGMNRHGAGNGDR